jgi:DNA helicase HerA-like ATPase
MMLYDEYLASRDYTERKPIRLLIFDMHSEYGLYLKDNLGNRIADGVGQVLRDKFTIYSPSEELYSRYRDIRPLKINYTRLTEADIRLIGRIFGVTETFESYLHRFVRILKDGLGLEDYWIVGLLASRELEERIARMPGGSRILDEIRSRVGVRSLEALRDVVEARIKDEVGAQAATSFRTQTSKLNSLIRYTFTLTTHEDPIDEIIDSLTSRDGSSVIISMGHYERETPLYMMIANLIARRLHERLMDVEEGETKIVIFLEEAHKFLGRDVYYQSPFGVVAREMRKKGVTLCVLDQRPGELDPDVVSMLWTNFVFTLTNNRDIETAVYGSPNPTLYSRIVPKLRRQTALIYGDAIRFPVVLEIIDYRRVVEGLKRSRVGVEDIAREIREF